MPGSNPLLAAALQYAAAGLAVLPLHSLRGAAAGACSCGRPAGDTKCKPGKHPRTPNGVTDATTDAATVRAWWQRWPDANIGIAGGAPSQKLLWIDFDKCAEEIFPQWWESAGKAARLPVVRTGQGYRAALRVEGAAFKSDPNLARGKPEKDQKRGEVLIETKGTGGYGIAPPSNHVSGRRFTLWYGDLCRVPTLPRAAVQHLLDAARAFDETPVRAPSPPPVPPRSTPPPAARPLGGFFARHGVYVEQYEDPDWPAISAGLSSVPVLHRLVSELGGKNRGEYLGEMTCPGCGQPEVYLYPPDGENGTVIRCNRLGKCGYSETLFEYLRRRKGGALSAIHALCDAAGVPRPLPKSGGQAQQNFARSRRGVGVGVGGGFGLPAGLIHRAQSVAAERQKAALLQPEAPAQQQTANREQTDSAEADEPPELIGEAYLFVAARMGRLPENLPAPLRLPSGRVAANVNAFVRGSVPRWRHAQAKPDPNAAAYAGATWRDVAEQEAADLAFLMDRFAADPRDFDMDVLANAHEWFEANATACSTPVAVL